MSHVTADQEITENRKLKEVETNGHLSRELTDEPGKHKTTAGEDEEDDAQHESEDDGDDGRFGERICLFSSSDYLTLIDSDPFRTHFAHPDETTLTQSVSALVQNEWSTKTLNDNPQGRVTLMIPKNVPGLEEIAALRWTGPGALKVYTQGILCNEYLANI